MEQGSYLFCENARGKGHCLTMRRFLVTLQQEKNTRWIARSVEFGCLRGGDTREEALENIRSSIRRCVRDKIKTTELISVSVSMF